MSNYLYFRHEEQGLNNRFNADGIDEAAYAINGLEDWRRLISRLLELLSFDGPRNGEAELLIRAETLDELIEVTGSSNFNIYDQRNLFINGRSTEELIVILLLVRLKRLYRPLPANNCPRLFISHRQTDKDYALRIAQLAAQNNFAYWVDVLDPHLQGLPHAGIPQQLLPLLTACIIEMALINCTHVIACMTPDTRGSLWLPYEYGRITELPGVSAKACAWLHPDLANADFPEYMLLGESAKSENDIETWLKAEWQLLGKSHCNPRVEDLSVFGKIDKLPEEPDDEPERKKIEFESWLKQGMPLLKDLAVSNFRVKFKRDGP